MQSHKKRIAIICSLDGFANSIRPVQNKNYDVVICENTCDSYLFTKKLKCVKVLDLPSPLADEIYYGNQLSKYYYKKFNSFLNMIYRNTDYLSFHWKSYTDYVRRHLYD